MLPERSGSLRLRAPSGRRTLEPPPPVRAVAERGRFRHDLAPHRIAPHSPRHTPLTSAFIPGRTGTRRTEHEHRRRLHRALVQGARDNRGRGPDAGHGGGRTRKDHARRGLLPGARPQPPRSARAPDRHRRLSPGRERGPPLRPRHGAARGRDHDPPRPLGRGPHRAGHPRLLPRERRTGRDHLALRPSPGARPLPQPRMAPRRRPRARVLPREAKPRPRLPARAAGRPLRGGGARPPVVRYRRAQRVRPANRRDLRLLRSAEDRARDPEPRGGRRPARDQPLARRPPRPRGPGIPVQAHGTRGGGEPRGARDVHGEADGARARERHAPPPERG